MKLNEALGKKKPRAMISTGDQGVALHLFDAAIFERLLFENPFFEARSMKHATPKEYANRIGAFIRSIMH